jgi:exonuclease VII small subunit
MSDIEAIITDLERASEALNDAAMSLITEAIRHGEKERPPLEKKVSQARRSVDKALFILRSV